MSSPVGVGLVGVTGGEEVLRPLMLAMVELEGQKYVTGSLVIPMVEAIRKGLKEATQCLKELSQSIGEQVLENGKDFNMESILGAMIEDFESRWGDGLDINNYSCRLGTNRGQPCGYTKEQVLCFTLVVQLPHVKEYQDGRGSVTSLARPMQRDDSGGSDGAGLLCICSTPCSDLNGSN
jgi:hypothetical protein